MSVSECKSAWSLQRNRRYTKRRPAPPPTAMRAQTLEGLRKRFEDAQKAGELPARTDAAALARFYCAVIQGMSVQARDGASRKELQAIAKVALSAWP